MEVKNYRSRPELSQDDSTMTKIKAGNLTIAARLGEEGHWRVEVRESEKVVFAAFTRTQADGDRIVVRVGKKLLGFEKPEEKNR